MSSMIGNKYIPLSRIGKGGFGEIWKCEDTTTHKVYAMKIASNYEQGYNQLLNEIEIYKLLKGYSCFPTIHWSANREEDAILVMDLLGQSLEDLFIQQKNKFSLKTTLLLAEKMLTLVECLHRNGLVHRDLKPANFMVDMNGKSLHLIDFGLAKKYINPSDNKHIPFKEHSHQAGTIKFWSMNNHDGVEHSRRDDLESIAYMLIYFMKGSLPWEGECGRSFNKRAEKVQNIKANISIEKLCEGLPAEFPVFLKCIRSLSFSETPHYAEYKQMFRDLHIKTFGNYDETYDWTYIYHMNNIKNHMKKEFHKAKGNIKSYKTFQCDLFLKQLIVTGQVHQERPYAISTQRKPHIFKPAYKNQLPTFTPQEYEGERCQ